ncbi:hypothetical protein Golob_021334 [Gossypium lobatum]|uniref:Uncharacterized protein n=1 Tax=Gossypium lobatum TaxID=34289 RepID=A0A7J8LD64_9ROSI|nr:hypothetical protein [Gossypium lobatum]
MITFWKGFIHNMGKLSIPQIRGYLQEDLALQLGLLIDGLVITGSTIVPGKVDLCRAMLGKVSNRFDDGAMSGHGTECDVDWWLFAPTVVVGLVAIIVSTSQSDRLIRVFVGDKEFEDFRLLLDQCFKVDVSYLFFRTYINYTMVSKKIIRNDICISPEVLGSQDMRNAKVSLIVYVMVEMYEPNLVLRQFGWRKRIPLPPRDIKELHNVDIRRKNDKDWAEKHKEHI